MKVAFLIPHFALGGVPAEFGLLVDLAKLGVEVEVFTSQSVGRRLGHNVDGVNDKEAEEKFGIRIRRFRPIADLNGEEPLMLGLGKTLMESDCDVFHSNEYYRLMTLQAMKAAEAKGKPLVFTAYRHCEPSDKKFAVLLRAMKPFYQNSTIKKADKILPVSMAAREYLLKNFEIEDGKIEVLSFCTNIRPFKPRKKPNENKLLAIGRLIKQKGHGCLIEACRILKGKGHEFQLQIIGNGPELPKLLNMISDYGLNDNVIIRPAFVENRSINQFINGSDVFVHPSAIEPAGLALIEAMSCGLPVVAANAGGPKDAVVSGKNGFLVEPMNAEAFAEKIEILLDDDELRQRFGRESRKIAEEQLSSQVVAGKHVKLYKQLLNGV